jgi:hypothetical protein
MILFRFCGMLALFLIPAAVTSLASAHFARTSRDEWQLLAWVPVGPLAIWAIYIAWCVARDPTSHNLWPFELLVWEALSLALLGMFLIARRVLDGRVTDAAHEIATAPPNER